MFGSRPDRKLVGAALLLGLLLSPPGHALGYLVLYGSRSAGLQSTGAHAYFPRTLNLSLELAATAAAAALLVIALGRLALGRALGLRRARPVRPAELVLVLLVVQLNVFAFQELAETLATGAAADLHWLLRTVAAAAAGQVPVALAGGWLLAWSAVRMEAALDGLAEAFQPALAPGWSRLIQTAASPSPWYARARSRTDASVHGTRGPPTGRTPPTA